MISIQTGSVHNAENLIKIAKELQELELQMRGQLPYRLNVITELHANENANSRILCGLFKYSVNGEYPFLASLIKKMSEKCCIPINIEVKQPEISTEVPTDYGRRIDLLISEKERYCIIIENKIYDARDQDKQIKDYIDFALNHKFPKQNIYVIYLTGDGYKVVSEYSLTKDARRKLQMTQEDHGRFICMNFKEDIVECLEEISQMECVHTEPLLHSAITQYLDYLKDKYELRQEDKIINEYLIKKAMDTLQTQNIKDLLKIWNDVNNLNNLLYDAANEHIKTLCDEKIIKPLKQKGYNIITSCFNYANFSITIAIPEFKKCVWVIEQERNNLYSGLRIEKGKINSKYLTLLKEVYEQQNEWWAGWKWHDFVLNDSFWSDIEAEPETFVKIIIKEIERVRKATQGMNL